MASSIILPNSTKVYCNQCEWEGRLGECARELKDFSTCPQCASIVSLEKKPKAKVEYTPTPWKRGWEHETKATITDSKGYELATFRQGFAALTPGSNGNARRVVACVNACEGISTEDLESGKFKENVR